MTSEQRQPDISANRLAYWRRRLGRIRLGDEPVDDQLARYKRVTWALTIVPLVIATIIVAIFTAFRAPTTGLAVASIIFGPMIALAWWDYARLASAVRAYKADRR